MAQAITHGKMAHNTLVTGTKIRSTGKENIDGTMAASTKAIGKITTWKGSEYILGRMAESMKEPI